MKKSVTEGNVLHLITDHVNEVMSVHYYGKSMRADSTAMDVGLYRIRERCMCVVLLTYLHIRVGRISLDVERRNNSAKFAFVLPFFFCLHFYKKTSIN